MNFKAVAIGFVCLAFWANTVSSVSWVVGDQTSGYTGMFIGSYDDWLVGNPRTVAYLSQSINPQTELGMICSGYWNQYAVIGNESPGQFDFNCQNSDADISANSGNVGYYVGGLNLNGNTVGLCYITEQTPELCDSDTISDKNDDACIKYIKCQ